MSDIQKAVQDKYGAIATSVKERAATASVGCCGSTALATGGTTAPGGPGGCGCADPITSHLYSDAERGALPDAAVQASLGCGNPTALIDLQPGQTVLDLGSGGGIDVLLSARRVGPTGKAYGLDMTDEMLALARENQQKAGATNVEFLKGTIEHIPLPDNSVDVVISNCVINLSSDKDAVLREAFRVLKPGGRFAVSDVVVRGEVPADLRRNMELWVGCIAGALQEDDYRARLAAAGFADVAVETWRVYDVEDARAFLTDSGVDVDRVAPLVKASKAAAGSCCDSTCCA
jgi:arsenite methyltransferase